ncbi:MAG: hypothetical protein MUE78_07205 [Ilumatobacteraceae bacterium]|jgi:hypothetical protein|nr:hypothetical protein [Ilumatobacteraceae bacterium]
MRKVLITLTTVGLLAVPAGMAIAQDDTPEPTAPVTVCEQDRDRVRDREHDQEHVVLQERLQTQERRQDGTCDGECDGEQMRVRTQAEVGDPTGSMTRTRQGEMGRG